MEDSIDPQNNDIHVALGVSDHSGPPMLLSAHSLCSSSYLNAALCKFSNRTAKANVHVKNNATCVWA